MQPNEFWSLSLTEFWWEFDSNVAQNKTTKPGSRGPGKFSRAEWEAARKKHREKMNG